MGDFRRYPKGTSRQVIDYNRVISQIGEAGIFCIDKGILSILRYLVGTRGLWRTTYSITSGGGGYTIPNSAEFEPIYNAIHQFLGEGSVDMSCDITAAIDRLAGRITGSTSCSTFTQTINNVVYYGTEAPLTAPTSFGGANDEFATANEYDSHKCLAATSIANALYADLQVIGSISTFQTIVAAGLTVLALTGVLALPALPLIIALSVAGLATGTLLAIKDAADWDQIKCLIYNSTGAVDAYDKVKSNLDDIGVSILGVGVTAQLVSDLIMSMANIDVFNKVFTQFTYFDDGTADCADCLGTPLTLVMGSLQSGNLASSFSVLSAYSTSGDCPRYQVQFTNNTGNGVQINYNLTNFSAKGCGSPLYYWWDGTTTYTSAPPASGSFVVPNGAGFWMRSQPTHQFTIHRTV